MNSPIENRICTIFVPVRDIERAIAWYSHILGTSVEATSHLRRTRR
jgi:predicted enzyme related to lactoylglutathione lyase